jgi:adenine-specific DNA-methyltransferase
MIEPGPGGVLHPAQRRYLAEDLVRLRRSDERRRHAAPQRSAKIDANPHQIDAVIFALARVREGGCILADEVGLGKTIEAGLVIAQLMAEGARRVLLIAPKPLLGQWRQELFQLFDIEGREAEPRVGGFDGEGVFLVGRESAGSEKGRDALLASEPFDLCVIDEAHEVFAGIYKRFDKFGQYNEDAPQARTAGRVRQVLLAARTPVLLLTATPIQNSLTELWGLVQFVDPLGTLLGDLPTFREVFCGDDDRQLAVGQEEELRSRLRVILQRTLRRQAQEFLEKPFVNREARLFEYAMSPAEKALYDDVTTYLLEPGILGFRGSNRQLLLLGFHRRMASSTRALAASLTRVAARLRRKLTGSASREHDDEDVREVIADLGDDDVEASEESVTASPAAAPSTDGADPQQVKGELERVEGFIRRAEALGGEDSKFRALLQALTFVTERARSRQGAGKLLIFTESLVTQTYLRDRLVESRLISEQDITLFRGTNESPRASQALELWRNDVPQGEGSPPQLDIATRLALVHEFKTRSRVFISTEAGAKGLNLQFCDTLVNYDLPWNPQRIEQRIGRCHRYGQQNDVMVINFIAKENEAQRLTFEILSAKLELFGTVLDASDQVLHRGDSSSEVGLVGVLGADFEAELRRIYDRARTLDEVTAELRALRDKVADERRRFETTHARTAGLIEKRFDDRVQRAFRSHKAALPAALAELDRDLLAVVMGYLDANRIPHRREALGPAELLHVGASPALPQDLRDGITTAIGPSKEHVSLHLSHPLVLAAVADARAQARLAPAIVKLPDDAPDKLRALVGRRGRLRVMKAAFEGFEKVEQLVPVFVLDDGELLEPALGTVLLRGAFRDLPPLPPSSIDDATLQDAAEETLFSIQSNVDDQEQKRFERAQQQADSYVEDRVLVLQKRRLTLAARLESAQQRQQGATGSVARTDADAAVVSLQTSLEEAEGALARLERRDDELFRRYQEHIQQRRYTPPKVERVFDLELVIE